VSVNAFFRQPRALRGSTDVRVRMRSCIKMRTLAHIVATTSVLSAVLLIGCQHSSYAARWSRGSHDYKSEVLKAPTAVGELKHIEWDGWGWAGQDTTVYLVFDPTDSLSAVANKWNPGKLRGIPCEVFVVTLWRVSGTPCNSIQMNFGADATNWTVPGQTTNCCNFPIPLNNFETSSLRYTSRSHRARIAAATEILSLPWNPVIPNRL